MNTDMGRPQQSKSNNSTVTRALPPIVKQVKENSLSILNNQLSEFFISCDDLFFDLAGKAGTNKEQNDFFDTMREIRLNKNKAISQFKSQFDLSFSALANAKTQPNTAREDTTSQSTFEGLGLVGNEEMERKVALSSTITKARGDCQESLYHLVLRLDYLLPSIDVNESNNPLDPAQICEAFSKSTDLIQLTLQNRIIFYKQFDRVVGRKLNKIINLANELFVNAGILPQIKPNTNPATSSKQSTEQSKAAKTNQNLENQMSQPSESRISEVASRVTPGFNDLSQLLSSFQASGHTVPGGISTSHLDGPAIQQDQLIQRLSNAQTQVPFDSSSGKNYIRDIVQTILSPAKEGKGKSLEQPDENVINLVAMFFDFILEDQNLPVTIQALIGRLQIPILKIALKDKTFFEDTAHPARALINRIAESSIGIGSDDKERQDVLFSLIQVIVQEVHDKYDGSLIVFTEQLSLLESQLATEQKRSKIIEKRSSEAAIGQAKTEKARRIVKSTISERIRDIPLPPSASDFLVKYWHKFLLSNHLRHGEQSPEWLDSVQVIDDLIWVMQPHSDTKSQQRATKLVPRLKDRILVGVKKANALNEDWSSLADNLFHTLELSANGRTDEFKQQPLNIDQKQALGIHELKADKPWQELTALERQQAKQNALRFESLQTAEKLLVSQWVIMKEPNARTIRCKLSAKLQETDSYIFVNRFGIKVLEKSKKEIAMSIQKGHLDILDSGLLFDRAMSRVTSTLRRTPA